MCIILLYYYMYWRVGIFKGIDLFEKFCNTPPINSHIEPASAIVHVFGPLVDDQSNYGVRFYKRGKWLLSVSCAGLTLNTTMSSIATTNSDLRYKFYQKLRSRSLWDQWDSDRTTIKIGEQLNKIIFPSYVIVVVLQLKIDKEQALLK